MEGAEETDRYHAGPDTHCAPIIAPRVELSFSHVCYEDI